MCSYFAAGRCNRDNCPYAHVYHGKASHTSFCPDFAKGFCDKGTQVSVSTTHLRQYIFDSNFATKYIMQLYSATSRISPNALTSANTANVREASGVRSRTVLRGSTRQRRNNRMQAISNRNNNTTTMSTEYRTNRHNNENRPRMQLRETARTNRPRLI